MGKETIVNINSKVISAEGRNSLLRVENFNAFFYDKKIISDINLSVKKNRVVSIMGPSGCGKTTFIRCINRMHEMSPGGSTSGTTCNFVE